jgi:hypothetical protein
MTPGEDPQQHPRDDPRMAITAYLDGGNLGGGELVTAPCAPIPQVVV